MRLLNTETLQLERWEGDPKIAYAILSHTWGADEVSFDDLQRLSLGDAVHSDAVKAKEAFAKISRCCEVARGDGYRYVWIDTCCIDKSSSAELSEAINSMFRWYAAAEVCYAYLADAELIMRDDASPGTGPGGIMGEGETKVWVGSAKSDMKLQRQQYQQLVQLKQSRWFTRGWTLQELLAPVEVVFYSKDWREMGTRDELSADIAEITGIPEAVLRRKKSWASFSVAQRLSWASGRQTTRIEDEAYSLLGLFDVNMPLLYGEGRKAFKRLQLEIMRESYDVSILAWGSVESQWILAGALASSLAAFEDCGDVEWNPTAEDNMGASKLRSAQHEIVGPVLKMDTRIMQLTWTSLILNSEEDALATDIDPSSGWYPTKATLHQNLVHFPKAGNYPLTSRSFEFSLFEHLNLKLFLATLPGCKKSGRTIGITLCMDAKGLLKRVHYPTRFLSGVGWELRNGITSETIHLSLSGSEMMLQQPPVIVLTRCMVRLPQLQATQYRLSHTIPQQARDAPGCWYLDRWGEVSDPASLLLIPCFSLNSSGLGRALVFKNDASPTESFLVTFSLVRPDKTHQNDWISVDVETGDQVLEATKVDNLKLTNPTDNSTPTMKWDVSITSNLTLSVRLRRRPKTWVAILRLYSGEESRVVQ